MSEDESVLSRPARSPDATITYGSEADQVADIRYGSQGAPGRPLLIVIHGGFWRPIYDRAHVGPMAQALAEAGWTVLTLEYRRIPGNPDATLQDIGRAVASLPARVTGHNGKAVLIGHSAGGHLALWAGATNASSNLSGILALAPAADLRLTQQRGLGDGAVVTFLGAAPETRPDADPQQLPDPQVGATIVHGDSDDTVTLEVSQSYVTAHPRTRLIVLEATWHFALIDPLSSAWPRIIEELRRFS